MSLPTFAWALCIFWVLIYAARAARIANARRDVLPSAGRPPATKPQPWKVHLRSCHLKFETTAFNALHDSTSEVLERSSLQGCLRFIYDLGSVLGVFGILLGYVVLGLTCYQTLTVALSPKEEIPSRSLSKRDTSFIALASEAQPVLAVHAIIPGVTVPFSHAFILLFALFVAQCIHELGHAIAAAIESVPLYSVGASLTLFLPSAFVSISSSLGSLRPSGRLRVISAGAWHNLLLWSTIYLSSIAGLGGIWNYLGWEDVTGLGVAVFGVEEDSPLRYHVKAGSIVVALDDNQLSNQSVRPNVAWSQFLLESGPHLPTSQGWCIEASAFSDQPDDCCKTFVGHTDLPPLAQLSCFIPVEAGSNAQRAGAGRCIDPVPLLTHMAAGSVQGHDAQAARCFSTSDCQRTHDSDAERLPMECVQASEDSQLLRITVMPPLWEDASASEESRESKTRVVLWNGPREEVYEQVMVGRFSPRSRYLSASIPETVALFFEYLGTISLSLYIFNLFALPFLDGSQFLSALLDWIGETVDRDDDFDIDFNAMESGIDASRRRSRSRFLCLSYSLCTKARNWVRQRKTFVERTARYSTMSLLALTVVEMAWVGL